MHQKGKQDRVVPVPNLLDYFRTSIECVISEQGVEVEPHATHYVVNLLTLFSRSEELYEDDGETFGLKPLAIMLADATDAPSPVARNSALQRIGDVALFISGFFADSLASHAVDLDYYIHMGGSAYGSLSEEVRGTFQGKAFADTYSELAAKFQVLVDVLNEMRDRERQESDIDLLRTYSVWRMTGSKRAENLLRQQGVVPIANAGGIRQH
ncbi:MAG: hypothetical protein KJO01_09065 [Gammaproteobacteria bacterium]|nr:hypothetical protein [Gammaproteobacteria bacterium]MBT8110940.1 hypothetical protein [Gammaproteobacteria bacterium]NND47373.1 hypothetical protein [Woeseiaceae bacterium]NNL45638.1 hypothetical protein [Woeseiaceae bacterium]